MRRRGVFLVTLTASLVLTACTTKSGVPSEESKSRNKALSHQQQQALADHRVTWDEYTAAYEAYKSCMTRAGYSLSNQKVKDDLYDFGVPGPAVHDGTNDRCYDFYWDNVDSVWQISHEDTSYSARFVSNCLAASGIRPGKKYSENLSLLDEKGLKLTDCPDYNDDY